MHRRSLLLGCLGTAFAFGCAPSSPDDAELDESDDRDSAVSADGFLDKLTVGYQGWFCAPQDGSDVDDWSHWAPGSPPAPGNIRFELYPDTRDYDERDLFETKLGPLGDGRPSRLFSSAPKRVTDLHFRWMAEYGIDGAGLQRFVGELDSPRHVATRTRIAGQVRDAAEKHDRIFYLEYDVSGGKESTLVEDIQRDFEEKIEGELGLTSSPRYARQDGKPVIMIWGLGFDDRPGTVEQTLALVQWFKDRGFFVGLGVPYEWRTEKGSTKPGFLRAYEQADLIQPWAVGAVSTDADVDAHFADLVAKDKAWCDARKIAYQRVIFPGFSWSNWNGGAPNMIPRRAGRFFWHQAVRTKKLGCSAFIAMFDEYDEGTAIAKAAATRNDAPSAQYFLTLDADGVAVSSDFYLRLAGAATQMMHGEAPITDVVPVPPA